MLGDTGTELVHDAACSALLVCPTDDYPWRPRKIVVGIDGSTNALAALRTAEELAAVSRRNTRGNGRHRRARRSKSDAAWTKRVETWEPAHPVAALVERSRSVDLIVVGSRGVHGLRSIGSISERVAHQAHCTTLVVHEAQASGTADAS